MNRAVVYLVALLLLCGCCFWAGWEWRDRSADVAAAQVETNVAKSETKAVTDARTNDHASSANVAKVEQVAADKTAEREVVFQTIEKEVVRYVESKDRGSCVPGLDADGLRIWRAANAGRSPEAGPVGSGVVPAAVSGVPAAR